jgi:rhodanese-related sulfurtransferase
MKGLLIFHKIATDSGGFALLLTGAACAGLLINQIRDHQLPLVYLSKADRVADAVKQIENPIASVTPVETPILSNPASAQDIPATPEAATPQPISLDDFKGYVEKKEGLILDARPEIFHRLGHVPGALSFPREDFDGAFARLRTRLEKDKSQALLVYCSGGECEDSQMVADGLAKLGYRRVYVFKGGWDEWDGAHLPEEKAE